MDDSSKQLLQRVRDGLALDGDAERLDELLRRDPEAEAWLSEWPGWEDLRLCHLRQPEGLPAVTPHLEEATRRLKAERSSTWPPGDDTTRNHNEKSAAEHLKSPPPVIPGFTIRREVGRGAMGVVYEAWDEALGRPVAIKALAPGLLEDPTASERLLREARAAAGIQHENVVAVHSICQVASGWVLVLQYVEGSSLQELLRERGPLALPELQRLARDLAKGLQAAHRVGLIHRDLKPDNILVDAATGTARIADFGLVIGSSWDRLTRDSHLAGTPAYMSPEQTSGGTVDPRSDLFALGVVLFRAATGRLPFQAEDPFVLLDQIRTQSAPAVQTDRPDLPPWFADLIARLLEKDPTRRPAAAEDVLHWLEHQTSTGARTRLPVSPVRAAAVAVLLIIASLGGWRFFGSAESLAPAVPGTAAALAPPPPGVPPVAVPTAEEIAKLPFSLPSGTRYATFEEALAAAADGDVVQISGDGPYLTDPVDLQAKSLTIVAAAGTRPLLLPRTADQKGAGRMLATDADLTLRGLHIRWTNPSGNFLIESPRGISVVYSSQGKLRVENCRIERTSNGVCLGVAGGELEVDGSWLESENCCVGRYLYDSRTVVRRSVLRGRAATLSFPNLTPRRDPRPSVLRLEQVTVLADCVVDLVLPRPPEPLPRVELDHCVVDGPSLIRITGLPSLTREAYLPDGMVKVAQQSIDWREQSCVYRREIQFLCSRRSRQLQRITPSSVTTLTEWQGLWPGQSTEMALARLESVPGELSCRHTFSDVEGELPEAWRSGQIKLGVDETAAPVPRLPAASPRTGSGPDARPQ